MSDEKIAALAEGMDEMRHEMRAMRQEMRDTKEELRTEMRTGFTQVNSRIDKVERKVDGITTLLLASEKANERLTDRVTRLERKKKEAP